MSFGRFFPVTLTTLLLLSSSATSSEATQIDNSDGSDNIGVPSLSLASISNTLLRGTVQQKNQQQQQQQQEEEQRQRDLVVENELMPLSKKNVRKCNREGNEGNKCGRCEGDCQSDDDCEDELVCYQVTGRHNRGDFCATIPGCVGEDLSKTDWCIRPQDMPKVNTCDIEPISKDSGDDGADDEGDDSGDTHGSSEDDEDEDDPEVSLLNCDSDMDCDLQYYCSKGYCMETGTCTTNEDCFNPSNIYPIIACVGPIYCNKEISMCSRDCTGFDCLDGSSFFNCLVAPCEVVDVQCTLDEESTVVSCANDYCGGCNSIKFDASGNVVCKTPTPSLPMVSVDECIDTVGGEIVGDIGDGSVFAPNYRCQTNGERPVGMIAYEKDGGPFPTDGAICCGPSPDSSDEGEDNGDGDSPDSCASDSECHSGYYCAQGICLPFGSCTDVNDCNNPTNVYPVVLCIGPIICDVDAGGTCGRDCTTGGDCLDGSNFVQCFAPPCDVVADEQCTLEELNSGPTRCVEDFCGGCGTTRYDPAGNVVCKSPTPSLPVVSVSDCENDIGGLIIGDIGDGAIFNPGYRCDSNGEMPVGVVIYQLIKDDGGNMIPVEGAVCCGPGPESGMGGV